MVCHLRWHILTAVAGRIAILPYGIASHLPQTAHSAHNRASGCRPITEGKLAFYTDAAGVVVPGLRFAKCESDNRVSLLRCRSNIFNDSISYLARDVSLMAKNAS